MTLTPFDTPYNLGGGSIADTGAPVRVSTPSTSGRPLSNRRRTLSNDEQDRPDRADDRPSEPRPAKRRGAGEEETPAEGSEESTDSSEPAGAPSVYWADQPDVDLSEIFLIANDDAHHQRSHERRAPVALPRILFGVVAAAVLVLAGLAFFGVFDSSVSSTSLPPVTSAAPEATTTTPADPTTTVARPTTTTSTSSTTSTTVAAVSIEPIGEPVDSDELRLQPDGIGELRFGDDATQVLGVLAASLGPPGADSGPTVSAGEHGTCPGDPVRIVTWGGLTVVATIDEQDGRETFSSYRLDARGADPDEFASGLLTAGGMAVGDTIAELEAIYGDDLEVSYTEDRLEGPVFELRDQGVLVLWGPITSDDPDGTVTGVFSPVDCS